MHTLFIDLRYFGRKSNSEGRDWVLLDCDFSGVGKCGVIMENIMDVREFSFMLGSYDQSRWSENTS